MAISTHDQPRDRRFQLRATASEEELIKVAADRQGVNVTEFILRSARENAEALGFGAVCGLAVALLFQALYKGAPFKWQDAWIGITLGPLMEEAVFRGYLFGLAERGLRKRVPNASWIVGIAIAAVFALCHLPKAGITGLQIGVIFVMGVVYAWLRIKSNSTTSPFLAHSAYNAIIFAAAALIA